jgi:hypothetical protein
MIQNVFSASGNALLRYEPRYDLCRCEGKRSRIDHALMRNFVTYNASEHELRPQLPLYVAAAGAGLISHSWLPNDRSPWSRAWKSVLVQAAFGCASNLAAEFIPDLKRLFRNKRAAAVP